MDYLAIERRQNADCPRHERTSERIAYVESAAAVLESKVNDMDGKIDTLFEKHDETTKVLHEIQLCINGLSRDVKAGFEAQELRSKNFVQLWKEEASEIREAFKKRVEYSDGVVTHYEEVVKDFRQRFDELAWVNLAKNSGVIKSVILAAFSVLVALAVVHFVDIMRLKELIK